MKMKQSLMRGAAILLLALCFLLPSMLMPTPAHAATIAAAASGNWSATAWPNTLRTGTITTSTTSAVVTGVGTAFTTEISIGNIVKTTGNVTIGTVLTITDNTHLTFTANAASTNSGIAYNVQGVGQGDAVTIGAAITVTVDGNYSCASIALAQPNPTNGITISGTNSITVSGAITTLIPNGDNRNTTIAVGAGSLSAGSIALTGSNTKPLRPVELSISTGSVTVSGDITSAGLYSKITFTGAGTLNAGGTFMSGTAGTFTASTGTVNFNAAGAQSVAPFAYTFNNLTLSGSGSKTTTGVTVNGVLSLEGTATASVAPTYGAAATLQYNTATPRTVAAEWLTPFVATGGVIIANTGTITLNEAKVFNASVPLTINSGATLAMSTYLVTLNGNLVNNGGTTSGSGGVTIAGTATQSIGSFTNSGTVTMTKTASSVATLTGAISAGPLTINGSGGTLNLGSGLTHTATNVTLTTGTLDGGSSTLNVSGTWSGTSGFTASTGAIGYTGSSQAIGALTYNNLTINQSSGNATLGGAATVNGVLTLTAGNLAVTDPNILTMGASATTVGATDVTGIVKRTSMVAATSYTFGNQYTTVTFDAGGTIPTDFSMKIAIGSAPSWKTGAVQRTYDIIRTGGSGALTMALHYLDAELNANTETRLVIWDAHLPTPPGDIDEHGRSNYDTTNNWVSCSNMSITYLATAFDSKVWALGDSALTPFTWTGATNTTWGFATNWTPAGVPSDLSDVVIPDATTTSNDPTLPATATISRMTIESGGILNAAASGTLTLTGTSGAWSNSGGTFNASTSTVIFTNAAATVAGTTDFYNVTVDTDAGLTLGSGSTMRIGGTMTNSGTWRAAGLSGSTVEYNKAGDQTVVNPNGAISGYHNLILSGSGTKTMPGTTLSVNGSFSMSGTASATAGAAINTTGSFTVGSGTSFTTGAYAHTIGGNFSNSGTFTATGSTVTLNGASGQAMTGATTFNNLTLNNSSGLTLNNDATVGGTLTFTSGNITTAGNNVIIASGGSVSRTSGHVVGNMVRAIDADGTVSRTFFVGTGSDYAPISVTLSGVSGSGSSGQTLTGSSTSGDHASVGSSGIDSAKSVNRYWTLARTGTWTFTSYDGTFNFVDGDKDGSTNTANFIVRKYTSGTWSRPPGGVTTSANYTTGLAFTSFSDYVLGEAVPWESYEDSGRTTVRNTFTSSYTTVYMKGSSFSDVSYLIAYYDAGGTKRASETQSASGGALNSADLLNTDQAAVAGTWHALVQPSSGYTAFGTASYDTIIASPDTYGLLANDSFTVEAGAIPEFSTVIGAIAVAGMCFGVYWWLRRRVHRGHGVHSVC